MSDADKQTRNNTLILERSFKASPQRIYEAWINPDILQKWWGPQGVDIRHLSLDVCEGGNWSTTFYSEQMGERIVCGRYVTLDPPNRLVFTWGWIDDGIRGHETQVEILLENTGDTTKMTLTQKEFAQVEHRDNHITGWNSSFTKLDQLIAG